MLCLWCVGPEQDLLPQVVDPLGGLQEREGEPVGKPRQAAARRLVWVPSHPSVHVYVCASLCVWVLALPGYRWVHVLSAGWQ